MPLIGAKLYILQCADGSYYVGTTRGIVSACFETRPRASQELAPGLTGASRSTCDRGAANSLQPLPLARVGDHALQRIEIERTRDDVVADDEAGRPVDVQGVGERQIGLESLVDIRRLHVLL